MLNWQNTDPQTPPDPHDPIEYPDPADERAREEGE